MNQQENSAVRIIWLLLIISSHTQTQKKKNQNSSDIQSPQLDGPHKTSCLCNTPPCLWHQQNRCLPLNLLSSTLSCWGQDSLLGFSSIASLLPPWVHLLRGRWIFSLPSFNHPFSSKPLSLLHFFPSRTATGSLLHRPHLSLKPFLHFFLLAAFRLLVPKFTNYGQTLKYHETPTTQSLTITAVVWGCFLLALNTCMVLTALQLSHLLMSTEILAAAVVPSAEAPMGKSDPFRIDTAPMHNKRESPCHTAPRGLAHC